MTENKFLKVGLKKLANKLQEQKEGEIVKKKGGRPKIHNAGRYMFTIPHRLHDQFREVAQREGLSMSSLICIYIKKGLESPVFP